MISKKLFKFNHPNTTQFIVFLLIATLPYFSLRKLTYGISPTLVLFVIICILAACKIFIKGKIPKIYNNIDFSITIYLILLFSLAPFSDSSTAFTVVWKSIFYFLCYLSLKININNVPRKSLEKTIFIGMMFGTTTLLLLSIVALVSAGKTTVLFSKINYWDFTFQIYKSIHDLFTYDNTEALRGYDLMRTTMSETFTFYLVIAACFAVQTKKVSGWFFVVVNTTLVLLMFSRRYFSLILLAAIVLTIKSLSKRPVIAFIFSAIIITSGIFVFSTLLKDSRLLDTNIESRMSQVSAITSSTISEVLTGRGVGTKTDQQKYIHNFIASSFYTAGLPGLITSMFVFLTIVFAYLKSKKVLRAHIGYCAMLMPFTAMLVGSTSEGILSPVSWIILALFCVSQINESQKIKTNTLG